MVIVANIIDQLTGAVVVQIDAHTDTLISEQASVILGHCGLAQLYGISQQHQPQQVCITNTLYTRVHLILQVLRGE